MFLEVLAQTGNYIILRCTLLCQIVFQSKQRRGLHSVQYFSLEATIWIQEQHLDVCPCIICHALVNSSVTIGGQCHITHHLSINQPIRSAQVAPIGNGIIQWHSALRCIRESTSSTTLQRLIAQPVAPLVITILCTQRCMVIMSFIHVVHKAVHRFPVLVDDTGIAKLLPYRPRYNNTCICPTQSHHILTILSRRSHTWESTCLTL